MRPIVEPVGHEPTIAAPIPNSLKAKRRAFHRNVSATIAPRPIRQAWSAAQKPPTTRRARKARAKIARIVAAKGIRVVDHAEPKA